MIAALYVDPKGVYSGLEGVECWGLPEKDARDYAGPWPVVAHPPCSRWAQPLAQVNQTRYGHRIGDDGYCFLRALSAVHAFGGVIEHPAYTLAWNAFGINRPARGEWLFVTAYGGWTTEVSQVAYGCPMRKRTWLYYFGPVEPPEMDWSEPPHTHTASWLQRTKVKRPRLTKREASRTPERFRDLLLSLAANSEKAAA